MNDYESYEFILESILERKHIAKIIKIIEAKDAIPGGLADDAKDSEFDTEQLKAGIKSELEHTSDKDIAKEIAKDHLKEDPMYYTKLKSMEAESVFKDKAPILEKASWKKPKQQKGKKRARKQTDKERHAKHKAWRKKNPEKVRRQVADHQAKTGQNKNREDTRQRKNRGEISKSPKCSKCGGTTNVQHDHNKGYAKGSTTRPLCHDCHTKAPQQNKTGEKSVKGGTVKVSKESINNALIQIISENLN